MKTIEQVLEWADEQYDDHFKELTNTSGRGNLEVESIVNCVCVMRFSASLKEFIESDD